MALASTRTMIPLKRVGDILGLDPYHFAGITADARRNAYAYEDTWYQYDWQGSGKLSREAIAYALRQAEDMVVTYAGWYPLPQWVEEDVILPTYYKTEWWGTRNAASRAKSVTTSYGFVTEVGRKTSSLIDTVATAFSDPDGDGFDDTVTISVVTSVTEEDELHIYYPDKDGRDEWEIRPVDSITISGGTATIVFKKHLIPLWDLVETVPEPGDAHILIDGDDNTNFLQTVDVYRVYADTSQQITFAYDPSDGDCTSTPCAEDTDTGCLFIRNSRLGILAYQRADYSDSAYTQKYFSRQPIKGTIYYRAGKQDRRLRYPNRLVDTHLERMIVFYALSLLDTNLCGCCNTSNTWNKMSKDLALITTEESHIVNWDDTRNPFGTTLAAMQLWKYLRPIRLTKSQNMV